MSADDRGLKRFSGEDDDPGRQLRRWRAWAQAKMCTMEKLSAKQQGPFLYTLLDGKALEAVEHLELDALQVEDGAKKVFDLLKERFPEKEAHDQLGEALGEVFGLAAKDGETVQQRTAGVVEVFTKCKRKADVNFPPQAQGWIALNCAGFSEEQKAIIKAKAQGKLDIDSIMSSMRSCFPQYKAGKARKPMSGTYLAEDAELSDGFADVEAFIADHELELEESDEPIPESEAAEALAASWKERRAEITKLRRDRRFDAAQASRKSFRVEIEELKRRTKCRKCGKVGHWARECRSAPSKPNHSSRPSSSSTSNAVEAQMVEQEVSLAQIDEIPAEDDDEVKFVGMALHSDLDASCASGCGQAEVCAAGLVSSPGFGVIDSGCGRTLIGKETLEALLGKLEQTTSRKAEKYEASNSFRFGNGATEVSQMAVRIPVGIGGINGLIDAAIISGRAPLLLGRPTLEKLNVSLDFRNKTMSFLDTNKMVPMKVNEAGQLLIDVMNFPARDKTIGNHKQSVANSSVSQADVSNDAVPVQCPPPEPVVPRTPTSRKPKRLKNKHCRCLLSQVKHLESHNSAQVAVAELFSPPRLTLQARQQGATGLAFDLKQGCNLLSPNTQKEVDVLLEEARPALLTASPPCTHCGGWDYLNQCFRTPLERARVLRESRAQIKFCAQQIQRQLHRGGHFLLEHPVGSRIWQDPLIKLLVCKYGLHRVDMCAYGLKCPRSGLPIKKGTALLCSDPELAKGIRTCPGCPKHQTIEGQVAPGVTRSSFTARYCPGFVQMLWKHIGPQGTESLCVEGEPIDWVALDCECLAGGSEDQGVAAPHPDPNPNQPEEVREARDVPPEDRQHVGAIDRALRKLHNNLGHPSTRELIRALKHSNASELADQRASVLQCNVCANQARPQAPLPANTSTATEFNDKIGLDVKYLPGWNPQQKIPCVNVVDYATSFQVMVPIFSRETGESTCTAFRDRWVAWAGPPSTLNLDPSQPNLSDALGQFCNDAGIDMRHTAADAHWQLGKTERDGQWFGRILQRVLDEVRPSSEQEWLTCLVQAQSAKNCLLTEAGASPNQLVFGRNPRVPSDLLQDSPHVPASEAAASVLERTTAIRVAARKAMLECQDDRALRAALRARPRVLRPFKSGDWVYYWRTQKSVAGIRIEGGRWYGAGLILGSVGRNLVVAHRRSLLRCSPEQLRFATASEVTVAEFPESELLGIKTLLERGQFPKSQFLDITQEGRPPEAPEAPEADAEPGRGLNAAQCLEQRCQAEVPPPQAVVAPPVPPVLEEDLPSVPQSDSVGPYPVVSPPSGPMAGSQSYAPIRRVPASHRKVALSDSPTTDLRTLWK